MGMNLRGWQFCDDKVGVGWKSGSREKLRRQRSPLSAATMTADSMRHCALH